MTFIPKRDDMKTSTPRATLTAALLMCFAGAAAAAPGKPYNVQEIACKDPTDIACLSWDLATAPGASRMAGLRINLMEGESISGVIKPKAARLTQTSLRYDPGLEIYIGMGFEPTETDYTCRMSDLEPCKMKGWNVPNFYFKVKAKQDLIGGNITYYYSVTK
ncbi:TPA: hypothetical protein UM343_001536 [Stenotrophomonas maltophilia]|nr:hypothetical protein [Stenotrophomonas maltophilia]